MKKHTTLIMIALFSVSSFLIGCESDEDEQPADDEAVAEVAESDDDESSETDGDEPRELVQQARELGPLADMIRDDADELDAWLDNRDMTEEELEELLFDISQDQEASRAYLESR